MILKILIILTITLLIAYGEICLIELIEKKKGKK